MVGGIEIKATQPSWGLGLAELGNNLKINQLRATLSIRIFLQKGGAHTLVHLGPKSRSALHKNLKLTQKNLEY